MRLLTIVLSAVVMAWTASAQAREIRHLQPSSKWVLNYAEDVCSLGRTFGEGDQAVTLALRQFVPGDDFEMSFIGNSVKPTSDLRPITAKVRFGPVEEEGDVSGLAATTNKAPAFIVQGTVAIAPLTDAEKAAQKDAFKHNLPLELPPIGAAREKAATWLQLRRVLPFDLVLETGPMDKPLEALRQCSWDTVKSWGLDVEQQKKLTRKASPTRNPVNWFSSDDYPGQMQREGYEGIVHFRVIVDEAGNPASCHIQFSTRPKDFDEAVCREVTKHAKFNPALDAAGKPIESYWRQTVVFVLGS